MLRLSFLIGIFTATAIAQDTQITVNWDNTLLTSKTETAFQTVVNPLILRDSPVHDPIFSSINQLNADHVRFVPWLPYPNLGVAELEPPSGNKLCGFRSTESVNDTKFPLVLDCTNFGSIETIDFVSYGQSSGYCGNLTAGSCSLPTAMDTVKKNCLGKVACTLYSNDNFFGGNPGCSASLAVQVTCKDPNAQFTYWDFSLIDPFMNDFMNATQNYPNGTSNHSVIINFSTAPQWLYDTGVNNRVAYPDDYHLVDWGYEQGNTLVDPTAETFGQYYGRLLAYYTEGGFYDEYNQFHPGYNYNISIWECLNELEHGTDVVLYTKLYDAMITNMQKMAPNGSKNMQFMAGALGGDDNNFWTYFLNMSNHVSPDIPIDYISFHYYGSCSNRSDPTQYVDFFSGVDSMVSVVNSTVQLRNSIAPQIKIDMDEMGVILPDDNDGRWTSDEPGFPNLYWNAAAGMFAYEFALFGLLEVDILGMSQLVGYPQLNDYPAGPGYLEPQFPSVAMLNWTTGTGTARYWLLKLLIDEFSVGDSIVNTTTSSTANGGSNPFCGDIINLADLSLQCLDPTAVIDQIQFASYGTPSGSCGNYQVGTCNAANSTTIVESYCLNKNSCTVPATTPIFGDPCYGTLKHLVVQAHCSTGNGIQPGVASPVYAQAYVTQDNKQKVLIINKDFNNHLVNLPNANGGIVQTIDESTGFGPARVDTLTSNNIALSPYAVVLVTMP